MKVSRAMYVFLATGLLAAMAYGQEYPFSDDFSSAVQTNSQWGKWYPTDASVSATCANGVYTIANSSSQTYPEFYHGFTNKVSAFTASCVVTRSSDTILAGMVLCLSAFPNLNGYAVQVQGSGVNDCIGYITIDKWASGASSNVWFAEYHQQNSSHPSDTLKVSKQGNTLTVFCNGVYIGSYTDNTAPISSGDFGFQIQENSTADFDNVVFTNQSTPGNFPTCVIDKFNNSRIENAWILRGCSYFTEDSVLHISAPSGIDARCETRMTIDTFYSSLIVSHRYGDSNSLYGFYLRGPDSIIVSGPNAGKITHSSAFFGITGLRACSAYLSSDTVITPKYPPPGYIHGKAFVNGPNDTIFYKDTIVVRKTNGSSNYVMYVNRHNLDTLTTTDINFQIVGAGIYASRGQNIFADYFFLGPDSNATGVVNIFPQVRTLKNARFSPMTSRYFFNPLGRIVCRRDAYGRLSDKVLAPGFYITDEKKSGVIINKQER